MEPLGKQALLDADGNPLSARLQEVLRDILRRLRSRRPPDNETIFLSVEVWVCGGASEHGDLRRDGLLVEGLFAQRY